jgi:hypothetical protein
MYWSQHYRNSMRLKPSEYWARQCFVGASFASRYETERYDETGRNMMWGSDYPHLEGTRPFTREALQWAFGGLPEDTTREILGANALRAYDFDPDALMRAASTVGPTVEELSGRLEQPPEIGRHFTSFLRG